MATLEQVFSDLVRAQIELWNAVDARLHRDHGFGAATLEPLRVIADRGGCRVGDIADDLVITVGGASKLVDRLESSGLCARRANPEDRRSSLIGLTAAGEGALAAATDTLRDELSTRLLGPLGDRRLDDLGTTLALLRRSHSTTGQTAAHRPERTTP